MRKIILVLVLSLLAASALVLYENPVRIITAPVLMELLQISAQDLSAGGEQSALTTDGDGSGEAKKPRLTLSFSETGHFYDEHIEVSIAASIPESEIYYTTDGSEPTSESERYLHPLTFSAFKNPTAVVLKAVSVYGGQISKTLTHTYFLGTDIHERFDTLVFSLSTNEEYLYDYDTGIFVEGHLRDEYIAANPGRGIEPPAPANFNIRGMEGERPVYVEVFTPNGERVVAQAAGVRVSGGWSRATEQKSMRLIARNLYEPNVGKFHYNFFPDETVEYAYGQNLRKFDTLVLRNGANDRDFGMLRNEVASKLAKDAGFRVVSPYRAASVFLNGEYYGFAWLQAGLNEQYLQDLYNAPTKDFDIVGDGDSWYNTEDSELKEALISLNEYAKKDLTDDKIFAELEAILDIDNMLLYYAYETYMDNNDWPHNNLKRWRYTGPLAEGLEFSPELDGRWRFIMYDLDWTLGLYDTSPASNTFKRVLSNGSPLLAAMLKRPELLNKFVTYVCAVSELVVTEENVKNTIADLFGEAESEIDRAFAARKYSGWTSKDYVLKNHANMVNYVVSRRDLVFSYLESQFGYSGTFKIKIIGGKADFGAGIGETARFLGGLDVTLKPDLPKFTVFDHWVLNGGKIIYENEIAVSEANAVSGTVTLELVTHEELPPLAFTAARADRERNGLELINLKDETVGTTGLFLSDSADNPFLWELPELTVKPGQTIAFAGKGSADAADLFKVQMPFRVKSGKVLILSDAGGNVLDYILVP